MTKTTTTEPTTEPTNDDELTVDAVWLLLPQQVRRLTAPGLSADERLRRAVQVVEELAAGEDDREDDDDDGDDGEDRGARPARVHVTIPLTFTELERTWPDARSGQVDPWYGDGDVDRANAAARAWSARYLLRALDGGR